MNKITSERIEQIKAREKLGMEKIAKKEKTYLDYLEEKVNIDSSYRTTEFINLVKKGKKLSTVDKENV